MILGKKVRVGPLDFTIRIAPVLQDSNRGMIDHWTEEIGIAEMNANEQYRTFWHEIVHSILDSAGQYDAACDEAIVSCLAHGIAGVLKDNPWVRRFYEKVK
jgi:hypothetical protein